MVQFILWGKLFFYIFYVTSTVLIGYSIILLLFDTPCLKSNWVSQENNLVNTAKSSFSVSLQNPKLSPVFFWTLNICLYIPQGHYFMSTLWLWSTEWIYMQIFDFEQKSPFNICHSYINLKVQLDVSLNVHG